MRVKNSYRYPNRTIGAGYQGILDHATNNGIDIPSHDQNVINSLKYDLLDALGVIDECDIFHNKNG